MKYFNQDQDHEENAPDVNMSPLIDMVFLLLIFFMVTTVFVRDTGIDISRPQADTAQVTPQQALSITLDAQGNIFLDGQRLTIHQVQESLRPPLQAQPRPVLILADEKAPAGLLVKLIDHCRLAGGTDVSVAATPLPQP